MKVRLILNPKAGGGTAKHCVPDVQRSLARAQFDHDLRETRGPGDGRRLVAEAREDGIECIAVIGGDGTLNEVSQGYVDEAGNPVPGPELAIIPAGTGGDFRKSFGIAAEPRAGVERLIEGPARAIDLGIVELESDHGQKVVRAFVNIMSFGLGGLTDRVVNQSPKWMGGRAAFFVGTLRAMLSYRNQPVRLTVDGKLHLEGPILNVAIANGRYFGGGMLIAPEADPCDGLLDVIALEDLTKLQSLGLTERIYRGTHLGQPGISALRGSVVHAEPLRRGEPVLIDLDGETPGRLPISAKVARGALRFRI